MHKLDLKSLIYTVNTAVKQPLAFSTITLNQITELPLIYVKSARHIVLEITNHEEYGSLEIKLQFTQVLDSWKLH